MLIEMFLNVKAPATSDGSIEKRKLKRVNEKSRGQGSYRGVLVLCLLRFGL